MKSHLSNLEFNIFLVDCWPYLSVFKVSVFKGFISLFLFRPLTQTEIPISSPFSPVLLPTWSIAQSLPSFYFYFSVPPLSFGNSQGFCSLPSLDLWAFCPIVPAPSSWLLPLVDRSPQRFSWSRLFLYWSHLSLTRLCRLYAFKASVKEMVDRRL